MNRRADLSELGPFQLIILTLSLIALTALGAELLIEMPPEARRVLRWTDNTICIFLLIDFIIRFRRAENKWQFMKWGWVDLLSSIPEIEALRWGRFFRVFRILRIIRVVRSLRELLLLIFRTRTQGGVASVFLITFLVLTISSTGILLCERTPEANITSAEDAVWWSFTTITTVGYGDKYPVTREGRALAVMLMISGVGLFGTMSGVIASFFLGESAAARKKEDEMLAELQTLHNELAELRKSTPAKPPPSS
jgi:voltage-gated potassium channel